MMRNELSLAKQDIDHYRSDGRYLISIYYLLLYVLSLKKA